MAALDYIRSSAHPQGRHYCGAGIATLTRPMRLLALGPQVYEIDLVGPTMRRFVTLRMPLASNRPCCR